MLINQKRINVLCFYIDTYCHDEYKREESINIINQLSKKYCCFLISDKGYWNIFLNKNIEIIPFNVGYPNNSLLKKLLTKTSILSEICFVSDDSDFIKNLRAYFVATVLIQRKKKIPRYEDSGIDADCICSSLSIFCKRLCFDSLKYLGENAVYGDKAIKGGVLVFSYPTIDNSFLIYAAGRYFGHKHYLSSIDCFSYAIKVNKNNSSQLEHKFDDLFLSIYKTIIEKILIRQNKEESNLCICSVPARPQKENRFSKMVNKLSKDLKIKDISSCFRCIKDYKVNKSLSRNERIDNVKDVFSFSGKLKDSTVILLDDIITSGATLSECASVLYRRGAEKVVAVVLAVNQWDFSSDFLDLTNLFLRYRRKDLIPFFHGKTDSYEDEISRIIRQFNKQIMQFDDAEDDFDF